MQSFDTVLTPRTQDDGTCILHIPEGWGQGKTVFGGFVVGALVRAMGNLETDATRRLRSLSAELVGAPKVGDARITVRTLRRGSAVTTICAELSQDGELLTHAVGVFGADRPFKEPREPLHRPEMPRWQDLPAADMKNPFAPEFTQNFEYRPVQGFPFSGDAPTTSGWVRPAVTPERRDDAVVAALADAWWLAEFVAMREPRPAATLTFGLDLHAPLTGLAPDAPLFHHGESIIRTDGYASEVRTLWREDGQLVSINRQLTCIIK